MVAFATSAFFGANTVVTASKSTCSLRMTLTRVDTDITVNESGNLKSFPADSGVDLRRNLLENGVDVYTFGQKLRNCGGNGSCGLCRVKVTAGLENMNERTPKEDFLLNKVGADGNIRLACRTMIDGPVSIETKPEI
uniref:2Fe-2S ferredoxin-type domain-containing protein n=1 Tax=Rhodosorus marinus TaxID=101924 RepID=A0A7S0BP16_9RHOD|mmetsp:Transcript_2764/g.4002  ORF Transcript_2764/g.4002 Transcript_2764/m.4002 type:complete len:137 (+) Transcript_2764:104-514(+)